MINANKEENSILKGDFEKIFDNYIFEKHTLNFSESPIVKFIRKEFKNDFEDLISELPYNEIISNTGRGNFANNPYLSIGFEKLEKLGLKHNYIFKEDMSGVILSMICLDKSDSLPNIEEKRDYYREQIRKNKQYHDDLFECVDLGRKTSVSAVLEGSTIISKFYSADNFPSDQELLKDLKVFMDYGYFLYDDAKLETIENINKGLTSLEQLMRHSGEKGFNSSIIIHGAKICEMMIRLYLEKEGFNDYEYRTFGEILHFCKEKNLLPINHINYLHKIRIYRNELFHGLSFEDNISNTHLEILNYFFIWFNNFYSQRYFIKNPFKINESYSLLESLASSEEKNGQTKPHLKELYEEKKELEIETRKLYEEIESLKTQLDEKDEKVESLEKELNDKTSKLKEVEKSEEVALLEKIDERMKSLEDNADEIKKTVKRTEEKVDIILSNIDDMIELLQKSTSRQINNTNSPEEKEKILENFTKDYLETIFLKYFKKVSENEEYEKERRKLQISLGENAWNKLSDKSKTFLITSKVMYNEMLMIPNMLDYSGVCIPVTKALEEEMFRRFFTDFIEYLNEKYGDDYSKYHSTLIHTNGFDEKSILFEDNFTMGTIAYLLCLKGPHRQKERNKKILIDYCKENIFSNKPEEEIDVLLYDYARNIEKIRQDYRNPSAHRHEIKQINAKECFDLVLDVEKLLKKMLDSFDY